MNDLTKGDKGRTVVIGFLLIVIAGIMSLFVSNLFILKVLLAFIVAGATIMTYGYIGLEQERKRIQANIKDNVSVFGKEYESYADRLGVNRSETQVTLVTNSAKIPHYVWIANNILNLFPTESYLKNYVSGVSRPDMTQLQIIQISVDSILYFEELGELRKYAKVTGGGSSLKGALLGYVLAGDVGVVLGSREPIKTEVISEDERRVELIYRNQNGEVENLEFTHDAYVVLKQLLPQKELRKIKNLQ